MPGWFRGTWGYHGDDGETFDERATGTKYGPTYGAGDTVGCGVEFLKRSAFFTKNGSYLGKKIVYGNRFSSLTQQLGIAFTELTGRLLPTCGFGERGTRLKVNFGTEPFMYTGSMSSAEMVTTV
jgi:hypothetical protein